MLNPYSTQHISQTLVNEILQALRNLDGYGSVEIYVQNNIVTQITIRNIKKTHAPGVERPSQRPASRTTVSVVSRAKPMSPA